jgi:hypothetical protein
VLVLVTLVCVGDVGRSRLGRRFSDLDLRTGLLFLAHSQVALIGAVLVGRPSVLVNGREGRRVLGGVDDAVLPTLHRDLASIVEVGGLSNLVAESSSRRRLFLVVEGGDVLRGGLAVSSR